MSIEAQLVELAEFAKREDIEITEQFIESKSAKKPGREIFNRMIQKIYDSKEPVGIISWHPDRLARNSVDGGQIIYLIDIGKIVALRFPCFWFEPTPQGLFMLQVAFGQSKYYSDNLSENVKRGIRQKLRRGEWLTKAPFGYINNPKTKNIESDPLKARIVKKMLAKVAQWEKEESQTNNVYAHKLEQQLKKTEQKLEILVNGLLDGTIDKEIYLKKKEELLKQKIALNQKKSAGGHIKNQWNEPTRQFILTAYHAKKLASSTDWHEIKSVVEKIGTNHHLTDKKASRLWAKPYDVLAARGSRPQWCAWMESNHRRPPYKGGALTTELQAQKCLQYNNFPSFFKGTKRCQGGP